jgi:HSP20 family protein
MAMWPSALLTPELGDLGEDVRRLFQDLHRSGVLRATAAGECLPALDVLETDEEVQILMDLPGVQAAAIRVLLKGSVLLVAGEKWSEASPQASSGYHLVERGSGRFARAVRIAASFDGSRARATLKHGELRVVLPKIADRRGVSVIVTIS